MHLFRSPAQPVAVPEVVVCGAHRASGATTLAALLAPSKELGCAPEAVGKLGDGLQRPLILTCRSSAWAAPCAVAAAETLAAAGHAPDVLVVIRDQWPLTAEAVTRFRQAGEVVGAVVTFFPFIRQIRRRPEATRLPGIARRTLADIRMLAAAGLDEGPEPGGLSYPMAAV